MRLLSILLLCLLPSIIWADTFKVTAITGTPKFRAVGQLKTLEIKVGEDLTVGGRVKMEAADTLSMVTPAGDKIDLIGKTYIKLEALSSDANGKTECKLELFQGLASNKVHKLESESVYQIRTPSAVAGVRGTEFSAEVKENGDSSFECKEGEVGVTAEGGDDKAVSITAGKKASVKKDGSVKISKATGAKKRAAARAEKAADKKEGKAEKKEEKSEGKAEGGEGSSTEAESGGEEAGNDAGEAAGEAASEAAEEASREVQNQIQEIQNEANQAIQDADADLQITIESIER